jgi:hypothetical protein
LRRSGDEADFPRYSNKAVIGFVPGPSKFL